MASIPRGVYREKDGWAKGQNSVLVDYGTQSMDMTEEKYREEGHQPPFEQLPWKPKDNA